jgi:hypothetical protein
LYPYRGLAVAVAGRRGHLPFVGFAQEDDWIEARRLPDADVAVRAVAVVGRWLAGQSGLRWNVCCFEAGEKLWRWT